MECNGHTGRYLLLHTNAVRAPPAEAGTEQHGSQSLKFPQSLRIPEREAPGGAGEESLEISGWIAEPHLRLSARLWKKIAGFDHRIAMVRQRAWRP